MVSCWGEPKASSAYAVYRVPLSDLSEIRVRVEICGCCIHTELLLPYAQQVPSRKRSRHVLLDDSDPAAASDKPAAISLKRFPFRWRIPLCLCRLDTDEYIPVALKFNLGVTVSLLLTEVFTGCRSAVPQAVADQQHMLNPNP